MNTKIHVTTYTRGWSLRSRDHPWWQAAKLFSVPEKEHSLLQLPRINSSLLTSADGKERSRVAVARNPVRFPRNRTSPKLQRFNGPRLHVTCIVIILHARNFFFTVRWSTSPSLNSRDMPHLETKVSYRCGGVGRSLCLLYPYLWEYYYHLEIFMAISVIKICTLTSRNVINIFQVYNC